MDEEENPYETLGISTTMTTHMLAGAAAGVMEHSVMYPIDCVKVRTSSDLLIYRYKSF